MDKITKYPVSQELFQALLDHFWRARDEAVPKTIEIYPKGYCISYKSLILAARVPLNPQAIGGPLFEIAAFCCEQLQIPLHSLVVNGDTGVPGGDIGREKKGFWAAPCSSSEIVGWAEVDVPMCIHAQNLPRVAPSLPG